MIESHRTMGGKTSVECRYFISSCAIKAQDRGRLIRVHWCIKNSLHWVLDVSWEDASQIRGRNGARNLALLRKIMLNLVRQAATYQGKHISLKNLRSLAAWEDVNYRNRILGLA